MRPYAPLYGVAMLVASAVLAGCRPQQPFYFHEKGDLSRYIGMATDIDYPDVTSERLSEVDGAVRPFSLANSEAKEIWELRLEDAVRYALENSKVIRSIGGQVQGPPEFLTRASEQVPTIYDPAIVETNARFGVEAALALFDTQWSTDVFWEHNNEPRNSFRNLQAFFPSISLQDQAQFQTQLQKTTADGATAAVRHNVAYDLENSPRVFPANWTANVEVEFRQPLLQGKGVAFNRIAGPGAIPGFNQGVLLARISTDIALAAFEANVRNLVSDVETAYWELYFAYRNLDAAVAGRNSALGTWRRVHALYIAQAKGGEAANEAQAREQYFLFRSTVEQSLNALYSAESKLRYIMGLAATDGRLIRPKDEPTTAKVAFDWSDAHAEALCRSVELREEKWRVKQRELELIAAKNYLLPRLDAVGRYRWLGLGEKMIGESPTPLTSGDNAAFAPFRGAYNNLLDGNFQDWHLELQMRMPLGFRRELSGVRNAQLSLARERAKLQETELEISHQLAYAVRDLEANLVLTQTNFNRRQAAQRQAEAVQAAFETGTVNIDVLLQAQRLLAQAESDYYRSLINYNEAIMRVHLRKGSLLEYNGVYLAEGPWPGKAYFDAKRRARARDAGIYLDYGFTMPRVLSRGHFNQGVEDNSREGGAADDAPATAPAPTTAPDQVPGQAPEPIPSGEPVAQKVSVAPRELPPPPKPDEAGKVTAGQRKLEGLRAAALGGSPTAAPKSRDLGVLDLGALGRSKSGAADAQRGRGDAEQADRRGPDATAAAEATTEASGSASGWRGVKR